jgi:hypothetical protein
MPDASIWYFGLGQTSQEYVLRGNALIWMSSLNRSEYMELMMTVFSNIASFVLQKIMLKLPWFQLEMAKI